MSAEEVERVRQKMSGKLEVPVKHEELPQMEATEMTEEENQAELQRVKEKADDGAVGVVKKVMQQKEVQKVLKTNINRQTFVSGLFMAALLIGFLQVSTAIKELINYSWQFDLGAGVILIGIGGIYMVKNVLLVKESDGKNDNIRQTSLRRVESQT